MFSNLLNIVKKVSGSISEISVATVISVLFCIQFSNGQKVKYIFFTEVITAMSKT